MPEEDSELARAGGDRDLRPAACSNAFVEAAHRPGHARPAPGGLGEHVSDLGCALFGDPSAARWIVAGLADARIEAEVADQMRGAGEAVDVADVGEEGGGDDEVDAG